MRSKFRGHFSETQETIDELWKTATFVFDANVLLNLYRYSDKTRKEFVRIITGIKDRVWIPEQCAFEFFGNRLSVISEQERAYKSTGEELAKIEERFSGSNRHPFLTEESHNELSNVLKKISKELEKSRKSQETRFNRDDIKETLADVFEGRVGGPFDAQAMDQLFKDGVDRYAESIPPGYKDKDKIKDPKTNTDKRRVYGDLILWMQTIARAKETQVDIVFVTDDSKEDWWQKQSGRTISPRPELIDEFCTETMQSILIYSPDKFVQLAEKQLGSKVSAATVDEVKADYKKERSSDFIDAARNAVKHVSENSRSIMDAIAAAQAIQKSDADDKSRLIREIHSRRLDCIRALKTVRDKLEIQKLIGDETDPDELVRLKQQQKELVVEIALCESRIDTLERNSQERSIFD